MNVDNMFGVQGDYITVQLDAKRSYRFGGSEMFNVTSILDINGSNSRP